MIGPNIERVFTFPTRKGSVSVKTSEELLATIDSAVSDRHRHQLVRVSTAHLLVHAVRIDPVIRDSFAKQSVTPGQLDSSHFNKIPENTGLSYTLSGPSIRALQRGVEILVQEGIQTFQTRHLILGLLATPEGYAINMIKEFEVDIAKLKSQMTFEEETSRLPNPIDRLTAVINDPSMPELQRLAMIDLLRVLR